MPHSGFSGFVHLHNHSEYSLLDGACRIDGMIAWAKETKAPAITITDHGNLFGAFEFYKKAKKEGVKPIIGCEFYIAPENRLKKSASGKQDAAFHLIALAKDYLGYKNLLQLISLAYLEGFYYVPRIDKQLLAQYHEGLIVLTSCLHGEVPYLINSGRTEQAIQSALELKNIMGEGNLYIELQNHFIPEEKKAMPHLIKIAQDLKIPLVATNDCHYLKRDDAEAHDVLLCIQTNKTIEDSKRLKFQTQEFYLKSEAEMRSLFYECPEEAITNSLEIAERCHLELPFEGFILPEYEVPKDEDANSYLKKLCYKGLEERYSTDKLEKARKQVDYELSVIEKTGFAPYFLIVHDYVNFARQRGVPVGPGRGSVGGSVAAYSLGITNFEPLQYDLIFERFLHTERVGMPDIDIDFAPERRDEIIEYVSQRYGRDKVAHIATFGTMSAKSVIRDVGRVLNMLLSEVDKVSKLIPSTPIGITIAEALESVPELKELAKDQAVAKLLKIAQALEGLKRHVSIHASGVVVSKGSLTEYAPILKDTKGQIATQYDMDSISSIGMVKFDFLGLKTLNVIHDTVKLVEENQKVKIDINKIPFDDQKAYDLLCEGNVLGVFQFETSTGIKEVVKRLKPRTFEEFIPIRSLYNPGPMESGMLEGYIKRKLGLEAVEYIHPILEPILKNTYGVCIYQEQVLQIARHMAGYTLGQADLLRSAMGKKNPEEMKKHRERFIEGAQKQGVSAEVAKQVFDLVEPFAGYAFPKSHAVAYSIISYQTAYLKANYPVEFMAALMSSDIGNTDQLAKYLSECRNLSIGAISVLPPDINESGLNFTVSGDNIRFGLSAIKNVGQAAVESILKTQQSGSGSGSGRFKSLFDFCERVDSKIVNRKTIESLIRCGAFDSLQGHRAQMLQALDLALESAQGIQKDRSVGQISLFDQLKSTSTKTSLIKASLPEVPRWTEAENWSAEKELLGVYISGHPLASYSEQIKRYTTASATTLADLPNNAKASVAGMISEIRHKIAKNEERMAFVSIEDLEGSVELIFFPKIFSQSQDILKEGNLIWTRGNVNLGRDENESAKLIVNEAMALSEVETKLSNALHLNLPSDLINEMNLIKIKNLVAENRGHCALFIHLQVQNCGEVIVKADPSLGVSGSPKVLMQFEEFLGEGKVWLSYEG